MILEARGDSYPAQTHTVAPWPSEFATLYPAPRGLVESTWPPTQVVYLGEYLRKLGCKTIVMESRYIDRDYISDVSLFYSRSLRDYPNHCQRLHFFSEAFDSERWRDLIVNSNKDGPRTAEEWLQRSYLGFSVARPLPGSPIGRTVVPTFPEEAGVGLSRSFGAIREYAVHLAGLKLRIRGLAFQQQDQGVSACATAALWSALHRTAQVEGLLVPTPAEITEAASRYYLPGGRSLPSEGLTIQQICEATRAAGLAPLMMHSASPGHDKAQLLGYISSGFAPVLAIQLTEGRSGHAVCGVGVKCGAVEPQASGDVLFRDGASAVRGAYIHDDRLGPYAYADLQPYTEHGEIRTGLTITWPGDVVEAEHSILRAIIVPVPIKLRLTISRMRTLGSAIAQAMGKLFPAYSRKVILNCRYYKSEEYRAMAFGFGMSNAGIEQFQCETFLSRYVGAIEIYLPSGPLFDVLLDATETTANPSALACLRRSSLPKSQLSKVSAIARKLGVPLVT